MTEPARGHTIRLRGPWEYWLAGESIETGRMDLDELHQRLLPQTQNVIELVRRFSRPTNLDADERVWLVIGPDARGVQSVELNGANVAGTFTGTEWHLDMTAYLAPRNKLRIECDARARLEQTRLVIVGAGER